MSRKKADAGNDQKYKAVSGTPKSKEDAVNSACADEDTDSNDEEDSKGDDNEKDGSEEPGCKIWLEVLPSKGGLLLAALLVEIMTEGMTPTQMNILGNFVASVGTLISYKASREDLDVP